MKLFSTITGLILLASISTVSARPTRRSPPLQVTRRQTACQLGTELNSATGNCDALTSSNFNYCWPGFSYAEGGACTQNPIAGINFATTQCQTDCNFPDAFGNNFTGYLISRDGHSCVCELPSYYDNQGNCSPCDSGLVPNDQGLGFATECIVAPAGYGAVPVRLDCAVILAGIIPSSSATIPASATTTPAATTTVSGTGQSSTAIITTSTSVSATPSTTAAPGASSTTAATTTSSGAVPTGTSSLATGTTSNATVTSATATAPVSTASALSGSTTASGSGSGSGSNAPSTGGSFANTGTIPTVGFGATDPMSFPASVINNSGNGTVRNTNNNNMQRGSTTTINNNNLTPISSPASSLNAGASNTGSNQAPQSVAAPVVVVSPQQSSTQSSGGAPGVSPASGGSSLASQMSISVSFIINAPMVLNTLSTVTFSTVSTVPKVE